MKSEDFLKHRDTENTEKERGKRGEVEGGSSARVGRLGWGHSVKSESAHSRRCFLFLGAQPGIEAEDGQCDPDALEADESPCLDRFTVEECTDCKLDRRSDVLEHSHGHKGDVFA